MLLTAANPGQMSKFMRLVNGGISRKLNDHHDRKGTMWHRRFCAIGVATDMATQEDRMRYILAHGVKERLVETVGDWPGASALPWLLRGETIEGVWTDFTARYRARRRKSYVPEAGDFETTYEVKLTVLPCWADMTETEWRKRIGWMIDSIHSVWGPNQADRPPVLGKKAVLAMSPRATPVKMSDSPAPVVHSLDEEMKKTLVKMVRAIRMAYAAASQRFRDGEWDVSFPDGTFRPPGYMVPMGAEGVAISAMYMC